MSLGEEGKACSPPADRLRSLDVFRGLTVALMIVVNNPGSWSRGFATLRHAPWNGWTLADLVFPWFLFSVGVSITLSFRRDLEKGREKGSLLRRAIRRSAVLFLVGLLLHLLAQRDFATLRIPGVLQRIAVCYLGAAAIFLWFDLRRIIMATLAILAGYWALLALVPVPGLGPGALTPDGNLAGWVDRAFLGRHIWAETSVFDPEGILSTLPALASTLLGVIAGEWLRRAPGPGRRATGLVVAGTVGVVVGLAWSAGFPINKSLWTSSYAIFAGGAGAVVFGLLSWGIDVRGLTAGVAPFEAFGINALPVFVFSGAASRVLAMIQVAGADGRLRDARSFLYLSWVAPLASPPVASLAWSLLVLAFWFAVAWALRERGVVIKA